jgi:hypothetical protein
MRCTFAAPSWWRGLWVSWSLFPFLKKARERRLGDEDVTALSNRHGSHGLEDLDRLYDHAAAFVQVGPSHRARCRAPRGAA